MERFDEFFNVDTEPAHLSYTGKCGLTRSSVKNEITLAVKCRLGAYIRQNSVGIKLDHMQISSGRGVTTEAVFIFEYIYARICASKSRNYFTLKKRGLLTLKGTDVEYSIIESTVNRESQSDRIMEMTINI